MAVFYSHFFFLPLFSMTVITFLNPQKRVPKKVFLKVAKKLIDLIPVNMNQLA